MFVVVDGSLKQSLHEVSDLTNQLDMLTNSLSGSEFASTPMSGKSTGAKVHVHIVSS